jgi:hypothetical protein
MTREAWATSITGKGSYGFGFGTDPRYSLTACPTAPAKAMAKPMYQGAPRGTDTAPIATRLMLRIVSSAC